MPRIAKYMILTFCALWIGMPKRHSNSDDEYEGSFKGSRRLLWSKDLFLMPGINCTMPAYHEFPLDIFTRSQREHGAVIVHLFVVAYIFLALAYVCDDYFVSSLGQVCEALNLNEDVAGATFMAAGSSAPELFTSVIGVFVAKGDVGTGTIVGSAVFNILCIVGVCGIFSGKTILLNWWPIARDSSYYSLAITVLILVMMDSLITWYEALIMLILYGCYIALMANNKRAQAWFTEVVERKPLLQNYVSGSKTAEKPGYGLIDGEQNGIAAPIPKDAELNSCPQMVRTKSIDDNKDERRHILLGSLIELRQPHRKMRFEEAALLIMATEGIFRGRIRIKCAGKLLVTERRRLVREGRLQPRRRGSHYTTLRGYSKQLTLDLIQEESTVAWKKLPKPSEVGYLGVLRWCLVSPIQIVFQYTIPDCRNSRWERWYMVTFIVSIIWIATLSYFMVWMVTLVGFTFGIPDSIMGITFLAAGTSIPDCMASLIVARQGQGDMAVSNTVGSNVFDILLGLALPWFIQTAMVKPGSKVHVNSNGLVYSVVLLFVTVGCLVGGIKWNSWLLNKRLGYFCLASYAGFLVISSMIESNLFGRVNPPNCDI